MARAGSQRKSGFTYAEKWIIWGVFCLLLGLSTSRFTVFAGLLLASAGISLIVRKDKLALGLVVSILGLLTVVFSKFLI